MFDPIDMDLSGLIIYSVKDAPIADSHPITLGDIVEFAHTGRPGILPKLLELSNDPSSYGWIEPVNLSLSRGLDDQIIQVSALPLRACPRS
jgi:hypothetical protein